MTDFIEHYGIYGFPIFFLTLWLFVTTILSALSGWFVVMSHFPDRSQTPVLKVGQLSGSMGLGVNMNGILTLSACPGGLRVGMWRIFGPFCRPFFVPWSELTIVRCGGLFGPRADLQFGRPKIGSLRIEAHIADRLGRAVVDHWPEEAPLPPPETTGKIFRRLAFQWLIMTAFAATFFTLAPILTAPADSRPPILVGILFPAVTFGVITVVRFLISAGRR